MSDSHERGMEVRREVLGDDHVDRAIARTTDFTADFQDLITRYAWGEIWTRPGLDRRTRSCITLTALVAGGHEDELAMHVRAALRNGLTPDEIKEVLLQTAVYCGVPAANGAFAIAQEVAGRGGRGMSRAVVLSAVRTPVGRYGGGLAGVRPGRPGGRRSRGGGGALRRRSGGDRGRLPRLREPGRRGQPQRRADGGAAGGPARLGRRRDASTGSAPRASRPSSAPATRSSRATATSSWRAASSR